MDSTTISRFLRETKLFLLDGTLGSGILKATLRATKIESLSEPNVHSEPHSRSQDVALRSARYGHQGILNEFAVLFGSISLSFFVLSV